VAACELELPWAAGVWAGVEPGAGRWGFWGWAAGGCWDDAAISNCGAGASGSSLAVCGNGSASAFWEKSGGDVATRAMPVRIIAGKK